MIAHTLDDLRRVRESMAGTVAVVPTMGALHEGHRTHMRRARQLADHVIVTVFVNPLQFRPGEDFEAYPRTLEADAAACAEEGVDVVFAPSEAELYPRGRDAVTRVIPGPAGDLFEGASRPGFFTGVLTVVAKLLRLTRAHIATFGEKDYQQLAMVRRMVDDLHLGVHIEAIPTVRESDGLAQSSRNVYLSAAERASALAIPRAIRVAQSSPQPLAAAQKVLEAEPGLRVDYVAVTAPDLEPAPSDGEGRLLIAAFAGSTRLIDNAAVGVGAAWRTAEPDGDETMTSSTYAEASSDPVDLNRRTTHIGDRDA
ncbi:pantoate--beta-alanine ligase [Natronoglycomyces albus]|uniref:Pantothenate synthetase n=2 Tax=Natronoglycomyces albus TaxID=2811108 RepID=A0A895XUF1_9ACTN|nr:pantoate--beta-alanine ligase [Natronoglycomyces albus]